MTSRPALIAGALAAFAAPLAAQDAGAFIVRLGTDTLAVEQYTRTATQLRGEQVIRSPRSLHRIYTVTYRADGSVGRFEMVTHNIGGGPGPMETRATAEFGASTVTMRVPRGDSSVTVSAPVPGPAAPWAINVFGLTEDVLRRARAAGGESFSMPIVSLGATEADTAPSSRSTTATRAPSATRAAQTARPMPPAPPVTTATRPLSLLAGRSVIAPSRSCHPIFLHHVPIDLDAETWLGR